MMKQETHIFQGMKRDNHPTIQQSSFLWDALNIRINRKEGDTFLAITNEKGNEDTKIEISGDYVGHCVIGKYLTIFTVDNNYSYIYRVEKSDTFTTILLFKGNLGFSQDYPIEAFGIIESDLIYKVYWIDGKHQPRFIIITMPEYKKVVKDNNDYSDLYKEHMFDFVSELELNEEVTISKKYGQGIFSPGTIQYALTYFNKYGQESNIFYTTPIQYISFPNRAGGPEDRISCSFEINVSKLDSNFDFLRVYSIHRTSLDAVPTVLQLPDVDINKSKDSVTVIDPGNVGDTVDPTKLLYIGGREFIPQTFTSKDGTLFFGDIELVSRDTKVISELEKLDKNSIESDSYTITRRIEYPAASFYIEEENRLDNGYNALFKTNETYRIGIQAQLSNGEWTQPVFIGDKILNTKYPESKITKSDTYSRILTITQHTGTINIPDEVLTGLSNNGAKKVRACVVFPSTYEREVICQGIINPTVYNAYFRSQNAPFAQASWFFRPTVMNPKKGIKGHLGHNIQHIHNMPLGNRMDSASGYTKEIQSIYDYLSINKIISPAQNKQYFYIDENIVTFNSPDIEFDTNIWELDYTNCKLRILGFLELNSIYGDVDIKTSSPQLGGTGFNHFIAGYNGLTPTRNRNNGGMVSQPLYYDQALPKDYSDTNNKIPKFINKYVIYPWHRITSLNNDIAQGTEAKRARSAVLETKVISNLKFFNEFTPIESLNHIDGYLKEEDTSSLTTMYIETPQLFNSNEVSILKQDIDYLHQGGSENDILSGTYLGNVDTLITTSEEYSIDVYEDNGIVRSIEPNSIDPIRMKYKSTPHLMFKFKNVFGSISPTQVIIPRHINAPKSEWIESKVSGFDYGKFPGWIIDGDPYDDNPEDEIMENDSDYKGFISEIGVELYAEPENYNLDYYKEGKIIYAKVMDDPSSSLMLGKVILDETEHKYKFVQAENGIYKIETGTPIYNKAGFDISTIFELDDYDAIEDTDNQGNSVTRYNVRTNKYVRCSGGILVEASTDKTKAIRKVARNNSSISVNLYQPTFTSTKSGDNIAPYLLLAELYKDSDNKYGGTSPDVLQRHTWVPASDAVPLESLKTTENGKKESLKLIYGDTWFDRYDCLKTYPFTKEDPNQIVEIGSFMCETRVNLNGRYDRNKGELSCLNMSPTNFNLLNDVYNQKDTFFNYRILDKDINTMNHFPYQYTWSLQKINGSDVDNWTNTTLANTADMNGAYGRITKLCTFNDVLLGFQEKALNAINFNNRVQIPVSDGVPIEISNGYKVDGSKVISSDVGCQDKWAIENSPYGIYFFDKYSKALYLYNGQLTNLSDTLGMKHWVSLLDNSSLWKPKESISNGIRVFYDPTYKDVYFTPGPGSSIPALCYSEELKQFSSMLSYNGTEAMFPWNGNFYSLHKKDKLKLWHNFVGDYNMIYEQFNPYYISFISNDNPLITKVFDIVEYQANLFDDTGELYDRPFNKIEVHNEYQQSEAILDSMNTRKKFRVWRTNIPRSSKVTSINGNVERTKLGRARIRNPWVNIKLTHDNEDTNKLVLSSAIVDYSI